jgi:hypothetical protein
MRRVPSGEPSFDAANSGIARGPPPLQSPDWPQPLTESERKQQPRETAPRPVRDEGEHMFVYRHRMPDYVVTFTPSAGWGAPPPRRRGALYDLGSRAVDAPRASA